MFPDKNYVLGRGELFFALFAPGTRTIENGQEYLGNTPEINLSTESETLDHFDSDHSVRTKDDSVLLEKNMSGTFITDQISPNNIARWFTGQASIVSQVSATGTAAAFTNVIKGRRYQLGVSPSNPSGIRGITNMSAVKEGTPDVTLVIGVDIKFDAETGGFIILPTSAVVDDGDDVTVTYDTTATTYNRITAGAENVLEGQLFYRAYNAKGLNFDYLFPYVQLAPDGDFALKGDDWQQLGFTFQALQRDNDTAVAYTNGRPGIGV